MSLISRLQTVFTDNRISNLDEAFEAQDIELPVGIYIHYADKEYKEDSTIVIRRYKNKESGDVLVSLQLENDTWSLRDHNHTEFKKVHGAENYEKLAQEIQSHLEDRIN